MFSTIVLLPPLLQALLDDFDYSDDEDDVERRLEEQRERLQAQETRLATNE